MAKEIRYENGNYWVTPALHGSGRFKPKTPGYDVYKNVGTHSVKVATIGYSGGKGLAAAMAEADKRANESAEIRQKIDRDLKIGIAHKPTQEELQEFWSDTEEFHANNFNNEGK